MRCNALQCVAVCCSVLQCVAVCYSVLQCAVVCCSRPPNGTPPTIQSPSTGTSASITALLCRGATNRPFFPVQPSRFRLSTRLLCCIVRQFLLLMPYNPLTERQRPLYYPYLKPQSHCTCWVCTQFGEVNF